MVSFTGCRKGLDSSFPVSGYSLTLVPGQQPSPKTPQSWLCIGWLGLVPLQLHAAPEGRGGGGGGIPVRSSQHVLRLYIRSSFTT